MSAAISHQTVSGHSSAATQTKRLRVPQRLDSITCSGTKITYTIAKNIAASLDILEKPFSLSEPL